MLLTDAFGGFGGISQFNRDFLTALDVSPLVERIYVWPRVISETIDAPLPSSVVYERSFSKGKLSYLWRLFLALFTGTSVDVVICGHINLLPAAWLVAKVRGARLALIIYGIDAWKPTGSALTNALAPRVDSLISISKHTADRFRLWAKVPEDRVYILPLTVDLVRFTPGSKPTELLSRYGLENKQLLLTVGRLASEERYKGFDQVLEALPELLTRFPALRYMIVGDGPDAPRLKQKAIASGIEQRVIFAGRVPEREKVNHYRLADVFVMPSSGEGFGLVLLEAAACGVPVIGSQIDGSFEALLQGELGKVIDPTSKSSLISAVSDSLSAAPERRQSKKINFFSAASFNERVLHWLLLNVR